MRWKSGGSTWLRNRRMTSWVASVITLYIWAFDAVVLQLKVMPLSATTATAPRQRLRSIAEESRFQGFGPRSAQNHWPHRHVPGHEDGLSPSRPHPVLPGIDRGATRSSVRSPGLIPKSPAAVRGLPRIRAATCSRAIFSPCGPGIDAPGIIVLPPLIALTFLPACGLQRFF